MSSSRTLFVSKYTHFSVRVYISAISFRSLIKIYLCTYLLCAFLNLLFLEYCAFGTLFFPLPSSFRRVAGQGYYLDWHLCFLPSTKYIKKQCRLLLSELQRFINSTLKTSLKKIYTGLFMLPVTVRNCCCFFASLFLTQKIYFLLFPSINTALRWYARRVVETTSRKTSYST